MIATTIAFSSTNVGILLPFIFIFLLVNVPFCLAQSLQVVSIIGNRLHITDDDFRGLCSCFIPSNKVGVDSERQSDIELNDNPMLRDTAILKPEASRDSTDIDSTNIELADIEDNIDTLRNSEIGRSSIITAASTIFLRPTLKKQVGAFNLDYRGTEMSNPGDTAKLSRRTTVRFNDTETSKQNIESSTRVIDNDAVSRITDNTVGSDESARVIDNDAVSKITDNTVGSDSKRRTTVTFADTESSKQSTAAATRITDDRVESDRSSSKVAGTIRDTISFFKRSTSKRSTSLPSSINESDEDL